MSDGDNRSAAQPVFQLTRMGWRQAQLAQAKPGTTTTVLYTCPTGLRAIVTSIVVCNTDTVNNDNYYIYHADDGTAAAVEHALFYDVVINKQETQILLPNGDSSGWAVRPGGIIYGGSTNTDCTISIYGYEIPLL